jgi:putative hemolysin
MALVVDEHGGVEGIVTVADLLNAVVGELRGEVAPAKAVRRDDGSWLVDGLMGMSDFVDELKLRKIPGDEEGFDTVGGLVLAHLRRIPAPGDHFTVDGWRFEVVDMDRNRIAKVLVTRKPESGART